MSLILVKGSPRSWQTFALTAVGLALLGLGVVLALENRPGVVEVSCVGGVVLLAGELIVQYRRRGCRWAEDLGDGFRVVDRLGEREYRDGDVAAIAQFQYERHSQGLLDSSERHFVVWVATEDRPIEMAHVVPAGGHDPLDDLVDRITDHFVERANDSLTSGGALEGDGWRLDRWGLAQRESAGAEVPQELPIDELTGVELVGRHLSIWRQGQEQVALRIPIASRNAHVLWMLLDERITKPEAAPPQAPKEGLGRLLYEFRSGRQAATALVFAVLAAGVGVALALSGEQVMHWVAGAAFAGSFALLAMANFYRKATLRVHEWGVFQTGMTRDREMRYDQMTTLTYSQERQFYRSEYTLFKGVYTGTNVSIGFEAAPDTGLRAIRYSTTLRRPDENLEQLRDRVAQQVADIMQGFLNQGQPIHWTTKATLLPKGLEYIPRKFAGRRQPVVLPYEHIGHWTTVETGFAIWHDVTAEPIVEEPTSQKNFYPGLLLFERLVQRDQAPIVLEYADEVDEMSDEFA